MRKVHIYSMWTFQSMPFDVEFPHPFKDFFWECTGDPTSLACDNIFEVGDLLVTVWVNYTQDVKGASSVKILINVGIIIITRQVILQLFAWITQSTWSGKSMWAVSWKNKPLDLCRCHTKRRIGRWGLTNPSFGMTPTVDSYSATFTINNGQITLDFNQSNIRAQPSDT